MCRLRRERLRWRKVVITVDREGCACRRRHSKCHSAAAATSRFGFGTCNGSGELWPWPL